MANIIQLTVVSLVLIFMVGLGWSISNFVNATIYPIQDNIADQQFQNGSDARDMYNTLSAFNHNSENVPFIALSIAVLLLVALSYLSWRESSSTQGM
jgi:hypothetical protein